MRRNTGAQIKTVIALKMRSGFFRIGTLSQFYLQYLRKSLVMRGCAMLLMSNFYFDYKFIIAKNSQLLFVLQVGLFVKACRDSIDALSKSIAAEEKKAYGKNWLKALGGGSSNVDLIAHQHGMVGSKITLLKFE